MENFYSFFITLYHSYTSIKLPTSYSDFLNQKSDILYGKQCYALTGEEAYMRFIEVFPDFLIRVNGRNMKNFIKFDIKNLNDFIFNALCLQPFSLARELNLSYGALLRKVIFKLSSSSYYIHYDIFTGHFLKYTQTQVNANPALNSLFVIETTFDKPNDNILNRNITVI